MSAMREAILPEYLGAQSIRSTVPALRPAEMGT
jgi:hypothetical protein